MSDINTYLNQVVSKIKTQFTQLITCEVLPGYLETTTLPEVHSLTPAIFVTHVGMGELQSVHTGQQDINLQMVAYLLIHNDTNALQREQDMMLLQSQFLSYLSNQRWGLANVHPTTSIQSADAHGLIKDYKSDTSSWRTSVSVLARAADLYGGSDPISQLSLWIVSWEQGLRIGENAFDDVNGVMPAEVYSNSFITDSDGEQGSPELVHDSLEE